MHRCLTRRGDCSGPASLWRPFDNPRNESHADPTASRPSPTGADAKKTSLVNLRELEVARDPDVAIQSSNRGRLHLQKVLKQYCLYRLLKWRGGRVLFLKKVRAPVVGSRPLQCDFLLHYWQNDLRVSAHQRVDPFGVTLVGLASVPGSPLSFAVGQALHPIDVFRLLFRRQRTRSQLNILP